MLDAEGSLFGDGADGEEGVADESGVALEVAQVVDDAGVVLDGRGFPAGDDGEVELVADARVLHVVHPRLVAGAADGEENRFGGREGFAEVPFVEESLVAG